MHYIGFLLIIGWLGVVGMPRFARAHTVSYDENSTPAAHVEMVSSLQDRKER